MDWAQLETWPGFTITTDAFVHAAACLHSYMRFSHLLLFLKTLVTWKGIPYRFLLKCPMLLFKTALKGTNEKASYTTWSSNKDVMLYNVNMLAWRTHAWMHRCSLPRKNIPAEKRMTPFAEIGNAIPRRGLICVLTSACFLFEIVWVVLLGSIISSLSAWLQSTGIR